MYAFCSNVKLVLGVLSSSYNPAASVLNAIRPGTAGRRAQSYILNNLVGRLSGIRGPKSDSILRLRLRDPTTKGSSSVYLLPSRRSKDCHTTKGSVDPFFPFRRRSKDCHHKKVQFPLLFPSSQRLPANDSNDSNDSNLLVSNCSRHWWRETPTAPGNHFRNHPQFPPSMDSFKRRWS